MRQLTIDGCGCNAEWASSEAPEKSDNTNADSSSLGEAVALGRRLNRTQPEVVRDPLKEVPHRPGSGAHCIQGNRTRSLVLRTKRYIGPGRPWAKALSIIFFYLLNSVAISWDSRES